MGCCKCDEHGWEDPQEPVYTDEEGKEYCVFHAPKEHKGKEEEDFKQAVFNRISRYDSSNNRTCNFSGAVFPWRITFNHFNGKNSFPCISFNHCTFCNSVSFKDSVFSDMIFFESTKFLSDVHFECIYFNNTSSFVDTLFSSDVFFINAHIVKSYFYKTLFMKEASFRESTLIDAEFIFVMFERKVNFDNAIFKSRITFENSVFKNEASFSSANFDDNGCHAIFKNATFNKMANFYHSNFYNSDFTNTSFHGIANFKESEFYKSVLFNGACFLNKAWFDSSKFNGSVSFESSVFESEVRFFRSIFCGSSFKLARFNGLVEFIETIFQCYISFSCTFFSLVRFIKIENNSRVDFENIYHVGQSISFIDCDLSGFSFSSVDLEKINFNNYSWPVKFGRYCIADESNDNSLKRVKDFYQRMKRRCKQEHNELEVSRWHLAEKEVELLLQAQQKRWSFYRFMLWLYRLSSRFGEDAGWAGLAMLGVVVLPLVVLVPAKLAETGWSPTFDAGQVQAVLTDWVRCLPLIKVPEPDATPLWKSLFTWGSQILIAIQATLFGFALRNWFRR